MSSASSVAWLAARTSSGSVFSAGSCQIAAQQDVATGVRRESWRARRGRRRRRPARRVPSTKPALPSTLNASSTDGSSSASATIARRSAASGLPAMRSMSRFRALPAKKLAWTTASMNPYNQQGAADGDRPADVPQRVRGEVEDADGETVIRQHRHREHQRRHVDGQQRAPPRPARRHQADHEQDDRRHHEHQRRPRPRRVGPKRRSEFRAVGDPQAVRRDTPRCSRPAANHPATTGAKRIHGTKPPSV